MIRRLRAFVALLFMWWFAGMPLPAHSADPGDAAGSGPRRVALVVGNGQYLNRSKLDNAKNDARMVCSTLGRLGFEVTCLYDLKSQLDFHKAIERFIGVLRPGDVTMFYFAGHGVESHGDNWLIPVGEARAELNALPYVAVSLKMYLNAVGALGPYANIVVLDTCRTERVRGGRITRGVVDISSIPAETMILYSTAPGRTADDGGLGDSANSVFTANLLRHIESPGLTIEEMFKSVSVAVQKDSADRSNGEVQVPWFHTSFTGKFCFADCQNPLVSKLTAELESEKRKSDDLNKRYQWLHSQHETLRAENASLTGQMQDLVARQQETSRTLAELESRWLAKSDESAENVSALKRDLEAAKQQSEAHRAQYAALKAEQDKLVRRSEEIRTAARDLDVGSSPSTDYAAGNISAGAASGTGLSAESQRDESKPISFLPAPRIEPIFLPKFEPIVKFEPIPKFELMPKFEPIIIPRFERMIIPKFEPPLRMTPLDPNLPRFQR